MAICRYRVRFEKRDALRFISHHDLLRVFELALRRSGLKVAFTQGFNPHPRLSFALALPLGVESLDEIVDIDLAHEDEPPAPTQLLARLGAQMPPGLVLATAQIATGRPQVIAAEYECELPAGVDEVQVSQRLAQFMAAAAHQHERSRGPGKPPRRFDARAFTLDAGMHGRRLFMRLRAGGDGGMKPSDLLTLLGMDATAVLVTKTRTLLADETTAAPETAGQTRNEWQEES